MKAVLGFRGAPGHGENRCVGRTDTARRGRRRQRRAGGTWLRVAPLDAREGFREGGPWAEGEGQVDAGGVGQSGPWWRGEEAGVPGPLREREAGGSDLERAFWGAARKLPAHGQDPTVIKQVALGTRPRG